MKDFEVFKKYPNFVLATVDALGNPHTRVVQYLFDIDGDLYFCTANTKHMFQQMKMHPAVSMIAYAPDFSQIARLNGTVSFLDDIDLKTRALNENPGIKDIYKEPTNPIFELCRVQDLKSE